MNNSLFPPPSRTKLFKKGVSTFNYYPYNFFFPFSKISKSLQSKHFSFQDLFRNYAARRRIPQLKFQFSSLETTFTFFNTYFIRKMALASPPPTFSCFTMSAILIRHLGFTKNQKYFKIFAFFGLQKHFFPTIRKSNLLFSLIHTSSNSSSIVDEVPELG